MKGELLIQVQHSEGMQTYRAGVEVPMFARECFEPLDQLDTPELAFLGGVMEESPELERVVKLRKDAANIMAAELSKMILDAMQSQDTINGYRVVKG